MKFWQKAFLGILAVFIVCVNVCVFLIARYSSAQNFARDEERARGEYHFIQNNVRDALDNLFYRSNAEPDKPLIESVMRSYADYYARQNVYLVLYRGEELLFANTPVRQSQAGADSLMEQRTVDGKQVLVLSGKLRTTNGQYALAYVRDLSDLYAARRNLTRFLLFTSAATEIVLSIALFFLLRRLTKPIRDLEWATKQIADGLYDQRAKVRGRDEFHDLAEHFNRMAESIERHVEELDRTARERQSLVDNLAHELRTPLTAICGYAEFLRSAHASEEDRITAADYVLSETKRMQSLALKLLDLALMRNTPIAIEKFSAEKLLWEVEQATARKREQKRIALDVRCELSSLTGDLVLLRSLLVNLVDNAANASPTGARVEIRAWKQDVPALLVRDFGCGMAADQVERVTEPFYRVDKARSRSTGGVGLGLALCAQIVKLHGAQLQIDSVPNMGTTIRVLFTTPLQPRENLNTQTAV